MPKSAALASDAASLELTPPLKGLVHTNPILAEKFLR